MSAGINSFHSVSFCFLFFFRPPSLLPFFFPFLRFYPQPHRGLHAGVFTFAVLSVSLSFFFFFFSPSLPPSARHEWRTHLLSLVKAWLSRGAGKHTFVCTISGWRWSRKQRPESRPQGQPGRECPPRRCAERDRNESPRFR